MTPPGAEPVDLRGRWDRFWFEPQPTTPLALVRILYGSVMAVWCLSHLWDLGDLYGPDGLLPDPHLDAGMWPLLPTSTPVGALIGLDLLVLVAAGLLAAGLWTRPAATVVFLWQLALGRRNPLAITSGDLLLRLIGLVVLIGPSGAALSIDRWRSHPDAPWTAPLASPWALRFLQLQLSWGYLITVVWKLQGTSWRDGLATGYALQVDELQRFAVPHLLWNDLFVVNVMTYGTLAAEVTIALAIWHPRLRRWAILAGLALHAAIDLVFVVGFFSWAMFCLYAAFARPERDVRDVLPSRLRSRLAPDGASSAL